MDIQKLAGYFANASYKWKQPFEDYNGFVRYHADSQSSTFISGDTIFFCPKGTDIGERTDLSNDILVAIGQLNKSNRYKRLNQRLNSIFHNYDAYKIYIAAHSLGASYALLLAKEHIEHIEMAYLFSTGSSISDVVKGLGQSIHCKLTRTKKCNMYKQKIKLIRAIGDPISVLSQFHHATHETQLPTVLNPHSSNNFTGGGIVDKFLEYHRRDLVIQHIRDTIEKNKNNIGMATLK
jgi:hypothetical protein